MIPARLAFGIRPFGLAALALLTFVGVGAGQSGLEAEAARFAAAWEAGDYQALGRVMRSEGIRLQLRGEEHVSIKPKQAQAALKDFLDRYPARESEVKEVSATLGDPALGFAEISFQTGAPDIPDPVIFSLFVGFALESDTWRVTEIRVFY